MRRLANENPMVRVLVLGGLLLALALVLYTTVLGNGGESASSETAPVAAGVAEATTDAGSPATTAGPASATPAGAPGSSLPPEAVPTQGLAAGKGLPTPFADAYADGKTVALLVVKRRGIDDRKLRRAAAAIGRRGDAALFVVRAKNIARYSRITLGVSVSRVPALVVVGARDGGKPPRASVSYGFRGTRSALQTVRDALYQGGKVPYFPE